MRYLFSAFLTLFILQTRAQSSCSNCIVETDTITMLTQHTIFRVIGFKKIYKPTDIKNPDSLYLEFYNRDNILVGKGYARPVVYSIKKGKRTTYEQPYDMPIGYWEYFYDNGTLRRNGTYTNEGEKMNDWKKYKKDGSLSEDLSNYSDEIGECNIEYLPPNIKWEVIPFSGTEGRLNSYCYYYYFY